MRRVPIEEFKRFCTYIGSQAYQVLLNQASLENLTFMVLRWLRPTDRKLQIANGTSCPAREVDSGSELMQLADSALRHHSCLTLS